MKRILALSVALAFLLIGCKVQDPKTSYIKSFSNKALVVSNSVSGNYAITFESIGNFSVECENGLCISWVDNQPQLSCFDIKSETYDSMNGSIADKIKTIIESNYNKAFLQKNNRYVITDSCIYGDYEIEIDSCGKPIKIILKDGKTKIEFI